MLHPARYICFQTIFGPKWVMVRKGDDYSRLSIVLPTLNEVGNVTRMVTELFRLYPSAAVIIIDDGSKDGTMEAIQDMQNKFPRLDLIERAMKKGLTGAIMEGMVAAKTKYLVVMDADFQHPPASVADVYAQLEDGADIVVGCRRTKGPLKLSRRLASSGAHKLAATYLWFRRQPRTRDLMSGFYGCRTALAREVVVSKGEKFERRGFKVLFDLLKNCGRDVDLREVGFQFGDRFSGKSKLNSDIIISVMKQCGLGGKVAGYSVEFFIATRAGRMVGILIVFAIFGIALMMTGGKPGTP